MKRSVLFLCMLVMSLVVSAQMFDYPTDTIDGQILYLYPVAQSEGLYRISKKFGVTQEKIIELNPELQMQGLKFGQTIKIPVITEEISQPVVDSANYIIHRLQPKETLFGISRKYHISIDELIKLNPETSKAMTIGSRLLIPKPKESKTKKKTAGITAAQNKEITDNQPLVVDTALTDSMLNTPTIRIAFLLPLMLDMPKREPSIDRFLEFYEGALLAINNLKDEGLQMEINTYDIEKNDIKLQTILAQPELQKMDAIIGPAYQDQVPCVAQFALENKIITIVPFTSKLAENQQNSYLFPFNPTTAQEQAQLAHYLCHQPNDIHCVLLKTTDTNKATDTNYLCGSLQTNGVCCSQTAISQVADSLIYCLQKTKRNIIICDTEKLQSISTAFPTFAALSENFSMELLGHYGWLGQASLIPIPMLYTSLFNTNAPQSVTAAYTEQFQHYFGHELSTTLPRYDMLGYDLTSYIISAIHRFGTADFAEKANTYWYDGVQSSVHFTLDTATNKIANNHLFVLKYANGQSTILFAPQNDKEQ